LLLVHAVLDAGSAEQYVSVKRTTGFGTTDEVTNASVAIVDPQGVVHSFSGRRTDNSTVQRFEPVYIIPLAGSTLQPGGTYTLRVTIGGEVVATGTTTLPAAVPSPPDTIAQFNLTDTLRFAWPRVAGARSYELMVQSWIIPINSTQEYPGNTYRSFVDTSVVLAGTARNFDMGPILVPGYPVKKSMAEIAVVAVDDNYYTYYHVTTDPFAGAPPSRLTGAIGVFASVVPVARLRISNITPAFTD
jgi:hypothetical protein